MSNELQQQEDRVRREGQAKLAHADRLKNYRQRRMTATKPSAEVEAMVKSYWHDPNIKRFTAKQIHERFLADHPGVDPDWLELYIEKVLRTLNKVPAVE